MNPILLVGLFVVSTYGRPDTRQAAGSPVVAYENGLWFDGTGFEAGTFHVVDGLLVREAPARVDTRIDLRGQHVVPPYAEGHNHLLEAALIETYDRRYLARGIFYVMDHANLPAVHDRIAPYLARPDTLDAVSAELGLTGPGGHPLQIIAQMQQLGAVPDWPEDEVDGQAVLVIEDAADLERSWPTLLASEPGFVKVFLLYSELHAERSGDPAYRFRCGIDPALVPEIVERARAANLRVSAHVYSAHDFRVAVEAGVDLIAHFPGTGFEEELGKEAFLIRPEDAERAAKQGTGVVSTLNWLRGDLRSAPARARKLLDEILMPNLFVLLENGVQLHVGSDEFRGTSADEALLLHELELFSPIELLTMWCETTPRMIFPDRRIGRLRDGHEASFLVLEGDPLEDFANTQRIALRVKQGHVLVPGDPEFPAPGGR